MTQEESKTAMLQARQDALTQRTAEDIKNLERDTPIRVRFHNYLVECEGYERLETPAPGRCYNGSTQQMLWECWLAATLADRAKEVT